MTAWHMAEIGSLAGWLPFDLYRTVRKCAKARNNWLHRQDAGALKQAPAAITIPVSTCEACDASLSFI
jgi:hypothetical protein